MTIKPLYSAAKQARIDEARRLGNPIPRLKPECWVLRGRLGGRKGRQVNRMFETREEAQEEWRKLQSEWQTAKDRGVDPISLARMGRMTLREFVRDYYIPNCLMTKLAPSSRRGARQMIDRVILPMLGDCQLRDLNRLRVDTWLADLAVVTFPVWNKRDMRQVGKWLKGEASRPTPVAYEPLPKDQRQNALTCLRSIVNYAFDVDFIAKNPVERLRTRKPVGQERRRRRKSNNDKMVDPMIIERVRLEMSPRDRTILRVEYVQGNRPHELAAWTWLDIRDPDTGEIRHHIYVDLGISDDELWYTKTYTGRWCKLFEPSREALAWWLAERTRELGFAPDDDDPVFPILGPRSTRTHLDMANWGSITLKAACTRAGVEPFNQYRMRATCAALLAAGGDELPNGEVKPWTLAEVASHLGHSQQTCERHYLGFFKNPGKYRGVPIEQVVRNATQEALEAKDAWRGELREMAETMSCAEIADRLNRGPLQPPRRRGQWTKASARALLQREGIHDVVSEARAARNQETLERLTELAETLTSIQIAAQLNTEGYPLLRREEGSWSREYVDRLLRDRGLKAQVLNPRYEDAKARLLELAGTGTHAAIAEAMNAEGHRDKWGGSWQEHNVGATLRRQGARTKPETNRDYPSACERLRALAVERRATYAELAELMSAEGHRGRYGEPWTAESVGTVLRAADLGAAKTKWQENARYVDAVTRLEELVERDVPFAQVAETLNAEGLSTRWGRRWTENSVYAAARREGLLKTEAAT